MALGLLRVLRFNEADVWNREVLVMKKTVTIALVSVAMVLPTFAQNKIDNRLGDSAEVLQQILAKPDEIPRQLLNRARCVLVFPGVKKVAVGIGGTYGRGVILCRSGQDM